MAMPVVPFESLTGDSETRKKLRALLNVVAPITCLKAQTVTQINTLENFNRYQHEVQEELIEAPAEPVVVYSKFNAFSSAAFLGLVLAVFSIKIKTYPCVTAALQPWVMEAYAQFKHFKIMAPEGIADFYPNLHRATEMNLIVTKHDGSTIDLDQLLRFSPGVKTIFLFFDAYETGYVLNVSFETLKTRNIHLLCLVKTRATLTVKNTDTQQTTLQDNTLRVIFTDEQNEIINNTNARPIPLENVLELVRSKIVGFPLKNALYLLKLFFTQDNHQELTQDEAYAKSIHDIGTSLLADCKKVFATRKSWLFCTDPDYEFDFRPIILDSIKNHLKDNSALTIFSPSFQEFKTFYDKKGFFAFRLCENFKEFVSECSKIPGVKFVGLFDFGNFPSEWSTSTLEQLLQYICETSPSQPYSSASHSHFLRVHHEFERIISRPSEDDIRFLLKEALRRNAEDAECSEFLKSLHYVSLCDDTSPWNRSFANVSIRPLWVQFITMLLTNYETQVLNIFLKVVPGLEQIEAIAFKKVCPTQTDFVEYWHNAKRVCRHKDDFVFKFVEQGTVPMSWFVNVAQEEDLMLFLDRASDENCTLLLACVGFDGSAQSPTMNRLKNIIRNPNLPSILTNLEALLGMGQSNNQETRPKRTQTETPRKRQRRAEP